MTLTAPAAGQKIDTILTDGWTDGANDATSLAMFLAASGTWTPVWSSSGTAVSLGNGTITGKYILAGKFCLPQIVLTMGSTTTFGTGVYRFSLPFAPVAVDQILSILSFDSSAALRWGGQSHIVLASATGDNMRMAGQDGTAHVGPANPFTWASGDKLILSGSWYEVA